MGTPLVGRRRELDELVEFVLDNVAGSPGLALVRGEAGIGKSRLVTNMLGRVPSDRVTTLVGHCLDLRTGRVPYAPLAEAFANGPSRAVMDALDALTGTVTTPKAQLYSLLRQCVERLARSNPLVLVIEDLHWADESTLDALAMLLVTASGGPWSLLGTYRDDEVSLHPELLHFLERHARHRPTLRIHLDRLSVQEVSELSRALSAGTVTGSRAVELHRRSSGIPLLVEELVAAELDGRSDVPGHLREVYLARCDHLSELAMNIVRAAAVAGRDVQETALLAMVDVEPDRRAMNALEEAVTSGCLVTSGTRYGFRHELLREAVLETLVPARRRALHGAFAHWLTRRGSASNALLAHHHHEAGQLRAAAVAAVAAAAEAEHVHAPHAAHEQWERVLELWPHLEIKEHDDVGGRAAAVAQTAEAAWQAGHLARARELVQEAIDLDPAGTTSAGRWERLARYRFGSGDGHGAEIAYRESLSRISDDTDDHTRVQALAGSAWLLGGTARTGEARPLVEQALSIAQKSGDPLQRCRALVSASWLEEYGLDSVTEANRLALLANADDELARSYVRLTDLLAQQGRIRDAADAAREGTRVTRERNIETYILVLTGWLIDALISLGEWDEAAELLESAPRSMTTMPKVYCRMHAAGLSAARGDGTTVTEVVSAIRAFSKRIPQQPTPLLIAEAGMAEHLCWRGEPEAAMEKAMSVLCQPRADYPHLTGVLVWLGVRAAADVANRARAAGEPGRVGHIGDRALDLVSRLAGHPSDPRAAAAGRLARAELTRLEISRDRRAWEAAIASWEALENPYRVAYAHWRLAEMLVPERTGRTAARAHLQEALQISRRLGAQPLLEAAQDLATRWRLGVGTDESVENPSDVLARALGITPREREVLALVAKGRTNREIAEILVISLRTVDMHVRRLLAKLGAARRTEAVDIARRQGLLNT